MKKLVSTLSALTILACATASFAEIKVGATPSQPFEGKDYVGEIDASSYEVQKNNQQQTILIMTSADPELNDSNLTGLTLVINEKDLPLGISLVNAVGKKIAVSFANANYEISYVSVVTPKYWNGSK